MIHLNKASNARAFSSGQETQIRQQREEMENFRNVKLSVQQLSRTY